MLEALHQLHEDDELPEGPIDDPLLARRNLIALATIGRKKAKLQAAMAAIQGEYQQRIDDLEAVEGRIRESLTVYLERGGECSFPDVGSAHLQTRKPSVKVVEDEAFAAWLIKGDQAACVSVDQRYSFTPQAKKFAAAALRDQGILAPGTELVPEATSLVVKGVK